MEDSKTLKWLIPVKCIQSEFGRRGIIGKPWDCEGHLESFLFLLNCDYKFDGFCQCDRPQLPCEGCHIYMSKAHIYGWETSWESYEAHAATGLAHVSVLYVLLLTYLNKNCLLTSDSSLCMLCGVGLNRKGTTIEKTQFEFLWILCSFHKDINLHMCYVKRGHQITRPHTSANNGWVNKVDPYLSLSPVPY